MYKQRVINSFQAAKDEYEKDNILRVNLQQFLDSWAKKLLHMNSFANEQLINIENISEHLRTVSFILPIYTKKPRKILSYHPKSISRNAYYEFLGYTQEEKVIRNPDIIVYLKKLFVHICGKPFVRITEHHIKMLLDMCNKEIQQTYPSILKNIALFSFEKRQNHLAQKCRKYSPYMYYDMTKIFHTDFQVHKKKFLPVLSEVVALRDINLIILID